MALFHGLRGPNVTVSNKDFAGESALIQAASLLRHGQADLAIVLAGDALAQSPLFMVRGGRPALAGVLQLGSFAGSRRFYPSEGVAALVMESSGRGISAATSALMHESARARWAAGGQPAEIIRQMLGGSVPSLTVCSGNGAPCATSSTTALAREISGDDAVIITPAGVCPGLGRYGRSFSLDPGVKQPAHQWTSPVVRNRRRQWICGTSSGVALLNMNVRIAAAAYAVPPDDEAVEAVLERERTRVENVAFSVEPGVETKGRGRSRTESGPDLRRQATL